MCFLLDLYRGAIAADKDPGEASMWYLADTTLDLFVDEPDIVPGFT